MSDKPQQTPETNDASMYEICVKGFLSDHWADWFDGMTITINEADGTSLLTGQVIDQAALYSLLRKLRDVGLQLQSVKRIDADDDTTSPTNDNQ